MASNTWDFLTWEVLIFIGFSVSVASILPPVYYIYVHHRIFSESVADSDHPESGDENPRESFIQLEKFEILSRLSHS